MSREKHLSTSKAYEIERLEIFHSPLNPSDVQSDQTSKSTYTNWKTYDLNGLSNKTWREYGQLAWNLSPDLAVSLYHT